MRYRGRYRAGVFSGRTIALVAFLCAAAVVLGGVITVLLLTLFHRMPDWPNTDQRTGQTTRHLLDESYPQLHPMLVVADETALGGVSGGAIIGDRS